MANNYFADFEPEQLARTFLEALRSRGLRLTREQLSIEVINRVGQIGLPLAEDYAPLPTADEWHRMTFGMDSRPARPSPTYILWGYPRPVLASRDDTPRIHFHLVLVHEADEETRVRVMAMGTQDLEGLRAAMDQTLKDAGIPMYNRYAWINFPAEPPAE